MIDVRLLRTDPDAVRRSLARRGDPGLLDQLDEAAGLDECLRALTARWIEQPVAEGRFFKLDTSTISILGYERDFPVVMRWNA